MHIIFGRAGTGKSEYIYQSIKRVSSGKVYIITPEQFSFSAEKRLVETVEGEATTKVEVLSFARMAHKVMRFMGLLDKDVISKSGKSMIIYDAISKNQKDLKFLGKSNDNVQTIITGITEFKKHNITVEDLRKRVEDEKNEYLKAKLNDMLIMYEALSEKIESFIDENDVLNILADNIEESHLFDGATFYLDEFAGFTKQEYNVI